MRYDCLSDIKLNLFYNDISDKLCYRIENMSPQMSSPIVKIGSVNTSELCGYVFKCNNDDEVFVFEINEDLTVIENRIFTKKDRITVDAKMVGTLNLNYVFMDIEDKYKNDIEETKKMLETFRIAKENKSKNEALVRKNTALREVLKEVSELLEN